MPSSRVALILVIALILLAPGCSGITSRYDPPVVSISSFKALPGQGGAPSFEIGLHIMNPNRTALELKGMAYTISLEGYKLLTGVSNDLPVIEAYGEGEIFVNARVSLFNSIAFFATLAQQGPREKVSYSLDAKLDTGGLSPIINLNKAGTISLGSLR